MDLMKHEEGIALVVGLILLAVLAVVAATAVVLITTDTKIGGQHKAGQKAFYAAEAGVQEALYRLGLFKDSTRDPPSGSRMIINGLASNDAHISTDPHGLLSNGVDDDGNGVVDDISDLNYHGSYDNRNWTVKIMLNTSESGYTDTLTAFYTVTIQASGSWLHYSSPSVDGTELTLSFKKDTGDMDGDGNTQEIVFYDPSLANPINVERTSAHASGLPILAITSTGRVGDALKRIRVEAIRQPVAINAKSALTVDVVPSIAGVALISGFNHSMATGFAEAPANETQWIANSSFKTNGVDNHGGHETFSYPSGNFNSVDSTASLLTGTTGPPNNEEELATEATLPYGNRLMAQGHKSGMCASVTGVVPGGNSHIFGGDDTTPWKVEGCPTYSSLAEVLGVDQATVDGILAKANVTSIHLDASGKLTIPPQGFIYIDNAGGTDFKITASTPGYDQGWGFMYVTGDADFTNFQFKGFIFIVGDAKITGNFWLLGGMAVKGATTGDFTLNNGHFLYSRDVLRTIVPSAMGFKILSWKEVLLNEG